MSTDSSDLFGALFEAPPANRTVPVLVPMPAPKPYSYSVPDGMAVEPGSVVRVGAGVAYTPSNSLLQPPPPRLAALHERIRHTFDPQGILSP